MIEDENVLAVQPSVVDGAMKRANSQSGSNEGAEFIVPRGSGHEPEKWYVKFGDDNPDRMWTEILADQIYREVMPAVVPETSPIIVEGRLARASKIVPTDEAVGVTNQARNEAFIMDCLLGNWDAVYNNANIVMSGGHGMRIDTGCSLDYRARGERKADGTFTGIVTELEFGTDDSRLALGMRQKYPGLSDADIEQQVERMRTSLTDDRIDELVDSIRRTLQDRTELKRVIKARRDYIIHEFNTQIPQAA